MPVGEAITLEILQNSPVIIGGIAALINHFKSQNPEMSWADIVNQFFGNLSDDHKAFIANQAEIAANIAANQ